MNLQNYSTFRIADVHTKDLITISSPEDVKALSDHPLFQQHINRLIIWGGSNIVFTQDFDGLVIANALKGRTIVKELNNSIILAIASGENRNDTVMRSVEQWYAGLENLVAIPGTVWAAPVQNIGAYGTEARDIILEVRGIDLTTGAEKTYTNEQCEFWYRESIFKHTLGADFFITEVVIQLIKANERIYHPKLHYAGVQEELFHQWRDGGSYITPLQVANAIATIRASKLPDWTKIGTCGSFFANPIVSQTHYEDLKKLFPDLVGHKVHSPLWQERDQRWSWKLSAGQLIELCGLKWYRDGDAGIYDRHALVLVNYGNATGPQIKNLITMIQEKIQEKFAIEIVPEVNVL